MPKENLLLIRYGAKELDFLTVADIRVQRFIIRKNLSNFTMLYAQVPIVNINKLPEHQCPDCLAAITTVREFPLGPRRSFYRADCSKCGWRGPKAPTHSNVEYQNQYPCPYCNRAASGLAELRDHLLGCESFYAGRPESSRGPERSDPGSIDLLFLTDHGAVVTGSPPTFADLPEEQQHNCDQMGCQQMHVLKRFASFVDERTASSPTDRAAEASSDLAHILDAEHSERVLGFSIKPCWCCGKPAEVDMSCTCARCSDELCWGHNTLVPVMAWNKRATI